jgi:hypothetical protein
MTATPSQALPPGPELAEAVVRRIAPIQARMKTAEAADRIRQLLADAGITEQPPTPTEMWSVFKRFAREPVDCTDEYLLFQVGDSDVSGDSYLDFCRGYRLADQDGHGWWEQTHAEFGVRLPHKLGYEQTDLFSSDLPSLDAFFAQVESMAEFQAGCQFRGWQFDIYHTGV